MRPRSVPPEMDVMRSKKFYHSYGIRDDLMARRISRE
jgi:hypothetical protein